MINSLSVHSSFLLLLCCPRFYKIINKIRGAYTRYVHVDLCVSVCDISMSVCYDKAHFTATVMYSRHAHAYLYVQ